MILVTGGAGFIGSNLVAGLNRHGIHDIVVCDSPGDGQKWRNIAKHEIADLIRPDMLNDYLDRHRDAVDVIFHMGANSSTTETDVDLIVRRNLRASLDIWERCCRYGIRLVYASSAATYGDGSAGFTDGASVSALAALRPLNAYGWSKHAFDRRVARVAESGGARPPQWVGLKFFNVYGPNEYHKGSMRSVIFQKFASARSGMPISLFKSHRDDCPDGGQRRDFVYVEDCVAVMLWLLESRSVNGLFNVGSGGARSFDELAHALFKSCKTDPKITYIDMPDSLRPNYQYFTEADLTRLRAAGYAKPFTSLEDGVERYVVDHLNTADPYR